MEWRELSRWAGQVQKDLDQRIADALRESLLRTRMASTSPSLTLPDFSSICDPFDGLSAEPWIGLAAGGLLAAAFGFAPALVGAAVGWLIGWVFGKEARRKKDIKQIVRNVRERSPAAAKAMVSQLAQHIHRLEEEWKNGVDDRLGSYADDLERMQNEAGTPLSPNEKYAINQSIEQIDPLLKRIKELLATLESACLRS